VSSSLDFFTVLAKPTGKCNLRCAFCYQSYNHLARGARMTPEVLEKLVQRVCEHPSKNTSLQWIGGESLAAGVGFYRHCEALLEQYAAPGSYVNSCIQTNGTLIDERWIDFLRSHPRYLLSISFEVLPHLQNSLRPGLGRHRESYPAVANGLRAVQASGIAHGILTVIESETLEVDPAAWLAAVVDHGIKKIGLQLSYRNVYAGDLQMVERYLEWIGELFELQAEYNSRCAEPTELLMIRESLYLFNLIRRPRLQIGSCHHLPQLCTDFLVSVDEAGRVYGHCDGFMGTRDADGRPYEIGNIFEQSFVDMLAGHAAIEIRRSLAKGRAKCRACSYYTLCRGGCGFFKAMQAGDIAAGLGDPVDAYCALTIGLMKYVTVPEKRQIILDSYRPLIKGGFKTFHFVQVVPGQDEVAISRSNL
jgi:radical SAM protein with 4Fe4S-binding SPASM domain